MERTKSKSYIRSCKLSFNHFIKYAGNIRLAKITAKLVENFLLKKYDKAKSAAHLYHRTLKAAFNKAIEWSYISENPFKKIKLPKRNKTMPVFISKKELSWIIEKTKNSQMKNLFLFAFHTGMRLSEIINLKWEHINLVNKVIKVCITDEFTTKNKSERSIPINDSLLVMLKAMS